MELLAIVVLGIALLMIIHDRSARRAATKRRQEPGTPRWGTFGGIGPIGTGLREPSSMRISSPITTCPRCGQILSLPRTRPVIGIPRFVGSTRWNAEYCSKCSAPLWETCRKCNGQRTITVPLEPREERYCSGCGYEWRQDKVIPCPTCQGKGRIATGHDVAHCRGS